MANHKWISSTLGHGETMCEYCKVTNREAAVLGMMNYCSQAPEDFHLPTLEELNKLPTSKVSLLLLRCLNTSDLTFMHDLLKIETRQDISTVLISLLKYDADDKSVSFTEGVELIQLAKDIIE